jgi:hypothetical protein
MYIDMALIGIIWALTTGRLAYRVYVRRDILGDKKPELAPRDIQKALQRVSVKLEMGNSRRSNNNTLLEERAHYPRVAEGNIEIKEEVRKKQNRRARKVEEGLQVAVFFFFLFFLSFFFFFFFINQVGKLIGM